MCLEKNKDDSKNIKNENFKMNLKEVAQKIIKDVDLKDSQLELEIISTPNEKSNIQEGIEYSGESISLGVQPTPHYKRKLKTSEYRKLLYEIHKLFA